MAGTNVAFISGNLGKDPELRRTGTGVAVCNFSIATSENIKNKEGEKEITEWSRIVAWGSLAEWCASNLKKGSKASVIGKIKTRSWEKEGVKQYTTEIVADAILETAAKTAQAQDNAAPVPESQLPF